MKTAQATTGETKMSILNSGMSVIKADGVEIIKRYEDAELVAVLHKSGAVGIYAEDEDLLIQVAPLHKSSILSASDLADKIMGL